ncbi:hypothetical protein PYCCODRAFT_1386510, partial [Trametes coccinea BRFM310]
MNNGDGRQTNQYPTGELVPFAPNSIVTPDDYLANLERIEQVKAALAFYEQQNNQGLQRFYEERQALEAAVQQGRLAAQRLAELQAQPVTDIFPTAPLPTQGPVAGPSAISAGQAQYPLSHHQQGSARPVAELPTSARIVEIPSPRVDAHAATAPSVQGGPYTQGQQRSTGQSAPIPPQYTNATSVFGAGMAHPQAAQAFPQYAAAQPTRMGGAYQQQQSYEHAARMTSQAQPRHQGAPPQRHPVSQQTSQPAYANRTPSGSSQRSIAPQRAAPPESSAPGPSGHAQSTQVSTESRYGTRTTSSLAGALGGTSSSTTESVPHAKVTYSSRHSAHTQTASAEPQKSGVSSYDEQQLFAFFKHLGPATLQRLMVQVLIIVERKQTGAAVSPAEEAANKTLNSNLQQACELISDRLKKYSTADLKQLFIKYFRILKMSREQAQQYTASIENATPPQRSLPNQPSASTSAQPAVNGALPQATSVTAPNQARPVLATSRSFTATVIPNIPATMPAATNAAPAPLANPHNAPPAIPPNAPPANPPNATPTIPPNAGISLHRGPLDWYQPGDSRMPVAYRDAQGQIRYMYASVAQPSTQAPSGSTPTPSQHGASSSMPLPAATQNMTTPEKPNVRPPSPWTPEKSDRRRLAQDILRSLGRPKGAFGDPLIEQPTTSTTAAAIVEQQASDSGKRKQSASPGDATPSKKQRKEEELPQHAAAVVAPPAASIGDGSEVINLTTPPSEDATETMSNTQDPAPKLSDDTVAGITSPRMPEELGNKAATLPTFARGESVASSEADAEKVQAMFIEHDMPDSAPSGPPSVGKASPPPVAPDFVDLPSVDAQLFAVETDEVASASNSADLLAQHPAANTALTSSSPAREGKTPLFLPSPSSSPGASGSAPEGSPPPASEDVLSDDEAAPRPLYGLKDKGKGKARERSVDIDLTTESRSVSPAPGTSRRSRGVFVAVPPLPPYAKRRRVRRDSSPDGTESEGTYGCNWHSCSHRFSDEAKLAHHLRKHAMTPLFCPYEGCDKSFNTPEAFLAHHKSSKHRDGVLRRSTQPFAPVIRQELAPLPEVAPAYLSIPRRVARHPISKERHQWLGPKVLENITAFKYSGGRSNAALPARSRRLAEKVAAAELAGVSPEAALAQIKRWIDDEYLAFADGYDAARRPGLRCADIPSQEITQILDAGFVFWPPEEDVQEAEAKAANLDERAPGQDPELSADAHHDARQELESPAEVPVAVLSFAADDSEAGAGVDQVTENVMLGSATDGGQQERGHSGQDGHGRMSDAVMSGSEAGDGDAAGGQRRLELPRRSSVAVDSGLGGPPATDRVGGGGGGRSNGAGPQTRTQAQAEEASGMLAAQAMISSCPWPVWPPPWQQRDDTGHVLLPAMQSLPSPGYLSARSAEVILSDVRPIKLKLEALQAVNVLLDEFLYSILSASRSLATDKLKAALLKVLPTSLGKEALLEAEVELKAYWERTTSARSPSSARNAESGDFDLQWSFELLRLKCEAYSTMNDSDEDAEAEKRLQQKMEAAGSSSPPNPSLLAPAALYLTAILEAICEHVLANVSRVAARDSGRTIATLQDLLTALCEDEGIYVAVKPMKAFEQIESLSKAQRPRRSKSFSRSTDKTMSRNSTSSPTPSRAARMSTDSTKSNAPTVNETRRTSIEKTRAVKIFHSRSLSDREKHEPAVAGPLARSQSEIGINREYPAEFEASACCDDEELQQEFDELMRSGATMKVSLTPDRLKSMEVYKQERTDRERGARRVGQGSTTPATLQTTEKLADGGAATGEGKRGATANGRPPLRHVDSIVEDDEETGSSANHHQSSLPAPSFQSNAASGSASASARIRNTSFTASPSPTMARANDQRLRSISISNVPHPRHEDGITRKAPTKPPMPQRQGSQNAMPPPPLPPQIVNGGGQMGTPKRTRKMGRNRESMDLDEIMNGSDGEDAGGAEEEPAGTMPLRSPTSASSRNSDTASTATSPRKPHISRAAQDLIAFLEAGPPEEPAYNPSPSMNASVISFESSKTRSGRLQRMMSRLTLGGSKESLNGGPKTPRSLSRKNSSKAALNMGMSTPPPSFKAASLASKRSIPESVGMQPYPNVIVATPPPRPVLQTASSILAEPASTPSSSHGSREDVSSQAPSLTRRSTRKAVPAFDDSVSPSSEDAKGSVNGHRYSSRDADGGAGPTSPTSVVRKPVQLNGHPVKIDTSEASLHPRSMTSPASATERDRKSPRSHAKAESGYASRSASRSPVTPSERLPPPPPPPPAPAIPTSDVEDLRRLMASATSADECRLLVDMFLAKNALLPKTEPPAPVTAKAPAATLEEALDLARRGDDEIERGLVALFLGGGGGYVDTSARLQDERDRGEPAAEHEP